jgi:hypothetical protein
MDTVTMTPEQWKDITHALLMYEAEWLLKPTESRETKNMMHDHFKQIRHEVERQLEK